MRKPWTRKEDKYLSENYHKTTAKELAEKLERTKDSVNNRIQKTLKLRKRPPFNEILLPPLAPTQWAYLAGFFDADGHPCIHWTAGRIAQAVMGFSNAHKEVIETMKSWLYGETRKSVTVFDYRDKGYHPVYRLTITRCADVLFAAKNMIPFVIRKKPQLQVLEEYCALKLSGELTQDLRVSYYREVKRLNQQLDTKRHPESKYVGEGK